MHANVYSLQMTSIKISFGLINICVPIMELLSMILSRCMPPLPLMHVFHISVNYINDMVYALPIPQGFYNYTIVHLEMLNIMVALNVWGQNWQNKCIEIRCDNLAVVLVLQEGRARDSILATLARNIWLLTLYI